MKSAWRYLTLAAFLPCAAALVTTTTFWIRSYWKSDLYTCEWMTITPADAVYRDLESGWFGFIATGNGSVCILLEYQDRWPPTDRTPTRRHLAEDATDPMFRLRGQSRYVLGKRQMLTRMMSDPGSPMPAPAAAGMRPPLPPTAAPAGDALAGIGGSVSGTILVRGGGGAFVPTPAGTVMIPVTAVPGRKYGFATVAESYGTSPSRHYRLVVFPIWVLAVLTALLCLITGLPAFRDHRAHRRRSRGLCPRCGYDLRASPDRCPECGYGIPSTPPTITTS